MAEAAVKFVLDKLAGAAVKEVFLLRGVDKQVEKLKRELVRIQAFLKDAGSTQIRDERQKNWVKEIRTVAHWVDDVIERALEASITGKTNSIKKMFIKPQQLPALHKLGKEIDEILERIKEINESRKTYGIYNLGEGTGGLLKPYILLPGADDPGCSGFYADTNNTVNQLLDESPNRQSVVPIVGNSGLGKTTLAREEMEDDESDQLILKERLQSYNLVERRVRRDGNCQFRALSDQFYKSPKHHQFVRQNVVSQLKSHREMYEEYVQMPYDEYVEKLSQNGEWGDQVTLQAASDSFGVKIFMLTSFKDEAYIEILPKVKKSERVIFLSFWAAEGHYNSIYVKNDLPS